LEPSGAPVPDEPAVGARDPLRRDQEALDADKKKKLSSVAQRTVNALHSATRAPAQRGNSVLKTTFKALHQVSPCPWRIGGITPAALILLHHEHDRTT